MNNGLVSHATKNIGDRNDWTAAVHLAMASAVDRHHTNIASCGGPRAGGTSSIPTGSLRAGRGVEERERQQRIAMFFHEVSINWALFGNSSARHRHRLLTSH